MQVVGHSYIIILVIDDDIGTTEQIYLLQFFYSYDTGHSHRYYV